MSDHSLLSATQLTVVKAWHSPEDYPLQTTGGKPARLLRVNPYWKGQKVFRYVVLLDCGEEAIGLHSNTIPNNYGEGLVTKGLAFSDDWLAVYLSQFKLENK